LSVTKYRIPETNLYLRADGIYSPAVEREEQVVNLTRKHAHLLEVVYHGQALQQMAVLSSEDSDGQDKLGIELVKDMFELFSFGIDYLEFAEKLNDWITGAHDAPDPIIENLRRIHETLSQIQDFALSACVSAREDNLAFLLAHSATAIQTANAFLQSHASRTDPVWAAKIAIAERDSLLAANTFSDIERGYWLRPYSLAAISLSGNPADYYYGWMPHLPDRAELKPFNQVWDYRWALPAFLYAIVARLVVLKAFATGSRAEKRLHCNEFKRYAKLLGSVFSKRWSGLRTLSRLSDLQRNGYLTTGRIPMAAVDLYGGDYLGGIFFASNFKPEFFPPGLVAPNMHGYLNPTRPIDLAWVDHNVRAFADHWWNVLYLRTGLDALFLIISELRAICDAHWFSHAYIEVNRKISVAKRSGKSRSAARVAAALSDLLPVGDEAARAARTHAVYEALHNRPDQAQTIVARCVRDLAELAGSRPPATHTEKSARRAPAAATTEPVKRPTARAKTTTVRRPKS